MLGMAPDDTKGKNPKIKASILVSICLVFVVFHSGPTLILDN